MSEVVVTVEAFSLNTLKNPEELVLTLHRNMDIMLSLPDKDQRTCLVNYFIRMGHAIASMEGSGYADVRFWELAELIEKQKEKRRNGMA